MNYTHFTKKEVKKIDTSVAATVARFMNALGEGGPTRYHRAYAKLMTSYASASPKMQLLTEEDLLFMKRIGDLIDNIYQDKSRVLSDKTRKLLDEVEEIKEADRLRALKKKNGEI